MRVSVLLPAREKDINTIVSAIRNLLDTAEEPEKVEIIVNMDTDAPMLEAVADSIEDDSVFVMGSPRGNGYLSLENKWNECAKVADGHWLMLWNCDATMLTEAWDTYLDNFKDPICVVRPSDNHRAAAFVIFPRLVYLLLGYVTQHPFMDWWINQLIYRQGGWPAYEDGSIQVHHSWSRTSPNATQSLALQHDLHKTRPDYWRRMIDEDVAKLKKAHEDFIRA